MDRKDDRVSHPAQKRERTEEAVRAIERARGLQDVLIMVPGLGIIRGIVNAVEACQE